VNPARAALPGLAGRFAAVSRPRRWAIVASALWAVVVAGYALGFLSVAGGGEGRGTLFLDAMFFLMTLTVPLVLVWLAARLAEALEAQQALVAALADAALPLAAALEAARHRAEAPSGVTPEAMRQAVQAAVAGLKPPDLGRPLDRLIIGQSRIETALQRLVAEPRAAVAPAVAPARAEAPADAPAPVAATAAVAKAPAAGTEDVGEDGPPEGLAWGDLVRALDFPRDADDREGFRALKLVLRHPGLAQMLQAAEDVLNLLSQEGVYVNDLAMDPVDPAAWRRYMAGVRGPEVDGVGGIRNPGALETARRLVASDSIFGDSALFFRRRFDAMLAEFAAKATDAELIEFVGTRSGRAFMLLLRLNRSLD